MWISDESIFRILEIEPTTDKKVIKKAYAKLVKKYHPEEYPEKWKEIHAAYEAAIVRAEGSGQAFSAFSVPDNEKMQSKPSEEKSDELDSLFDNIDVLSEEQQRQNEETFNREIQLALKEFKALAAKKVNIREWEAFFGQDERLQYICTMKFLIRFGKYFLHRKINDEMYFFLKDQMDVIKKYIADKNINVEMKSIGSTDTVNLVKYVESIIYVAYQKGKPDKERDSGFSSDLARRRIARAGLVIVILSTLISKEVSKWQEDAVEQSEMPEIQETSEAVFDIENDNMFAEDDSDVVYSDVSILADKIQIGDVREVLVEILGEPDEIRKVQENPDYEEVIYRPEKSKERLVIVLEREIVTDIYVEYVTE